jgi:hypothetical protein
MNGHNQQMQPQQQPSILRTLGSTFARTCLSSWTRAAITLVCALVVIKTGVLVWALNMLGLGLTQIAGALLQLALVVLVLMWAITGIRRRSR